MRYTDSALLVTNSHMGRDVIIREETQKERRGWIRRKLQETSLGKNQVKEKPIKD